MKKNKRRKKRSKKLVKFFVILILLFSGIISFCLFTPFFNLTEVIVTGAEQISEEQIIASSNLIYGENIFKINKSEVAKSIKGFPEIESVKISRKPFSKIQISVTETYPHYIFKSTGGYVVTNENAKVMRILESTEGVELPLILGIEAENAKISEKMSVQDTIKFDIIVENLNLLMEKGIINELSAIDFTDLSSTEGYLKGGAKVIFGKLTDLDYKLSVLLAVLPQIDASPGAYIDLTTPSNAFYGREEETAQAESTETEDSQGETSEETQNSDA